MTERLYLVCRGCGEAFDELRAAFVHADACDGEGFDVLPESEAM